MDEITKMLDNMNIGQTLDNLQLPTNTVSSLNPQTLLGSMQFTPSLGMKVMICLFLVLFISLGLVRASSSFARSIGLVLLFVSLLAVILIILNL